MQSPCVLTGLLEFKGDQGCKTPAREWGLSPAQGHCSSNLLSTALTFQFQEALWHNREQESCQGKSIKKVGLRSASPRKGVDGFRTRVRFTRTTVCF